MNKELNQVIFLEKEYQKSMSLLSEISSSLAQEYDLAQKQLHENQYQQIILNIRFMKDIEYFLEKIKEKIMYDRVENQNLFLKGSLNSSTKTNFLESVELDPYKYIETNRRSSQIMLFKPNMTDQFLDKISQFCKDAFTIKLQSHPLQHETQIEDTQIVKLQCFDKISVLSLKNSAITDESIGFIRNSLLNIKEIDISGCYLLTDQSLKFLSECRMVSIRMNEMESLSEKAIFEMISLSHSLNYLQVMKNPNIKEDMFMHLFSIYSERRAQLKWLELTTDFGVDIFINKLSYMTSTNPVEEIVDDEVFLLLGGKPHLKGLFFDNCQDLTKKAVQFISSNCHELQRLCLSKFIQLNDGLVQTLSLQLPRLNYLDINSCYNITDNSLYHLAVNVPHLQFVCFEKCRSITDEGLSYFIKNTTLIKHLNLSYCYKITDASPIYECAGLTYLNLSYCDQITDSMMEAVSEKSQQLKHLNLNYCENLTDSSISMIATRLKKLESLEIEWCQVSQKCIRHIVQNLTGLRTLNLSFCPYVCDEQMNILSRKMKKLEVLKLDSCDKVTEEGLEFLSNSLSQLRVLCLKQCEANDTFIRAITSRCDNLEHLDLSWCTKITDRSLFSISKVLYNLSYLNLGGCIEITDEGLQWLSASVSKIEYLNLTLCNNITDDGIISISRHMKYIKVLFLCNLQNITDTSISSLSNMTYLEQLHLLGLTSITSSSLVCLLHNLDKLVFLNISECLGIEGEALTKLCQFMGNLKFLEISQIQIEDDFLFSLSLFCQKVQYLNICYCKNVTDDAVLRLIQRLPRLIKLELQNTSLSNRTKEKVSHALNCRRMQKIVLE